MEWKPIALNELVSILRNELADCSQEMLSFFEQVKVPPVKWTQSPWGENGGGFWVVGIYQKRVLWYNDIEEGFNVSSFSCDGEIPVGEYWCNQDNLCWVLTRLKEES